MCGICGYVGLDDKALLLRMVARQRHRGPDEEGIFVDNGVGLGHRRLSIIDLKSGQQPMGNEAGDVWVVYNGEIYNFPELRRDLESRGHCFRTVSDTEVIIHAYEEYGMDCLLRFNGMWALAIWDSAKARLLIARDRLGIKPVCYYQDGTRLVFASEYKAILEYIGKGREVDMTAVDHYLTWRYVPEGRTLVKGVRKLPAGHYLVFQNGRLELHRYWALCFSEEEVRTEGEWLEEFRSIFDDAVSKQLISDVPLGAFLSGGIDSTAIVDSMARLNHRPIKTFAIGFGAEIDETAAARAVAKHYGTIHTDMTVDPDDLELLPQIVWHLEDPIGDAIVVPLFLLSRMAAQHVKVILTGEGADELLGGYIHQSAIIQATQFDRFLPYQLRQVIGGLIRLTPVHLLDGFFQYPASLGREGRSRLAEFVCLRTVAERYRLIGSLFTDREKKVLYSGNMAGRLTADSLPSFLPFAGERPLGNQLIAREFENWLPENILFKQDRLSMAHGIEARVPFLDHRLVELTARMPLSLKSVGHHSKIALRKALAGRLPGSVLRGKKRAFYMPLEGRFKNKFRELVDRYLSPQRLRRRGLFNEASIRELIIRAEGSTLICYKQLMALVILEIWMDLFIDGVGTFGRTE